MTTFFRKLPIKFQLMGWLSIVVTVAILTAGWVITSLVEDTVEKSIIQELSSSSIAIQTMIETSLKVSVSNHLRGIAEKNVDILKGLQQDVIKGKMSLRGAKELAEKIMLSQPIGETGYIYALTSQGIMAVHPRDKMKGRDLSDFWLAKTQIDRKQGYIEYKWKNPGEAVERSKALYMEYFAPWDWIISVSSYRDEFKYLFDVEDLKPGIMSFRFGDTGYAFILDAGGDLLVHPEYTSKDYIEKNSGGQNIYEMMLELKSGQLSYDWQDPLDGRERKKLVFFNYIPELKWVVASCAYLDEIYSPLYNLRKIILITIIVTILLILPISYYLGTSISRPLTRLARKMNAASSGNFDIRAEEDGQGEIGNLAYHFNCYMDRLRAAHNELHEEVGERIRAEAQLKLFAKVFENTLEGISIANPDGNIIAINKSFTNITGYSEDEAVGQNPRILKSNRHNEEFYRDMWQSLINKGQWVGEIWNRRKSGEAYPEFLSISAICDKEGEVSNYVAVFHDISEIKSQEERIKHQAYHDALTGLPNRLLARDRLTMVIAHAKRKEKRLAVFFLDLDNFKNVNDSLGHATGDIVLQKVAVRLTSLLREEDTVARLGGDEFLIIVAEIQSDKEVIELSDRLLEGFRPPIIADGHELFMTVSIGIAFYPEDGPDEGTLIKNADVAMYQSKSLGKNKHYLFTSELSERANRRMRLEGELRQALNRNEFTVYYQPKVDPVTNRVVGVEALVRWLKDDGSIVSPADFIPLAEETGLIVPLGKYVLEESCKAITILNHNGGKSVSVAVNLSPLQFQQTDIVESVLDILQKYDVMPSRLELEITEGTMMTNLDDSVEKLNVLMDAGISVAIDDFGTGYSSLYYLKTFPISTLKIDQSFIRDITCDQNDAQIVETIILMAKNLGLGIVAEGVETEDQLELLKKFGCELVQGYYYSRPLPLDGLILYLTSMAEPNKQAQPQ